VALKVAKNRDEKLGKTEIYLYYPRSRMMTKEEYQKQCEAVMECVFHAIRPPNPRGCGHLIHDDPAGQSTAKRVVAGAKRRG
jgi:hypothetical protein